MFNRLLNIFSEKGINNLIVIVNDFLYLENKEIVFILVINIILVDGVLFVKEEEFLINLY